VEYQIAAPGASPSGMTLGADGNLWFVDTGDPNRVGRVTPSGTITEFAVPGSVGGPETITTGPDGNVWMVAEAGTSAQSWILRVRPNGTVTRYPVPGTAPDGITTGPDGNIWFTEIFRNEIGEMTPAGVLLNEFPTPGSSPRGIVAGPDGNLWFTEADPGGSAIARMSPDGAATDFPQVNSSQTNQLNPTAIVAGPDGNLWFTEPQGHSIGRITPAGQITEFPLPGAANPQGLARGPDGNLWFTAWGGAGGGMVGHISPSGTIRLFGLPGRTAEPIGIAAGRDGRMWFTEAGVNRVGSIGETVPEVGLTSRVLSFGTELVQATHSITVTNNGDAVLNISSATITGADAGAFSIGRNTCGGGTVAIGGSCQVDVALAPRAGQGVLAALLQLTDNATGSPQYVSLVAQLPSCRLPVFAQSDSPLVRQGEFLDLRTGVVTPDPRGKFEFNSKTGQYSSTVTPTLTGQFPAFYDPIAGRWLPASSNAISPDHSRYAYAGFSPSGVNRTVHVVDVASGRDRAVALPAGPWSVVGFGQEGIYVNQSYDSIGPGLTLVNPDSGAVRKAIPDGVVFTTGDGAAWVGVFNPKDPLPPPPSQGGTSNEVVRRDFGTGQSAPWLYVSGASLYVAAESQSRLLVTGYFKNGSGTWIVTAANQAQRLIQPVTGEDFALNAGFVTDANGTWIGGLDGVYLWRPEKGLSLVSDVVAAPAGSCS
jgi:streptogramin lyase